MQIWFKKQIRFRLKYTREVRDNSLWGRSQTTFWTTYPPPLVNVVCERPLITFLIDFRFANKMERIQFRKSRIPCTITSLQRWFSVGIFRYKPGYKSHDLL